MERVASAGVLGESRLDGILMNTAASAVCITSDLLVTRTQSPGDNPDHIPTD